MSHHNTGQFSKIFKMKNHDIPFLDGDKTAKPNHQRCFWRKVLETLQIIFLIVTVFIIFASFQNVFQSQKPEIQFKRSAPVSCRLKIVESVPEGMVFNKTYGSIYSTWKSLIEEAEESIDIASFYWTLRGSDVVNDSSAWQGEDIFQSILEAGLNRSIKIRIVESKPSRISPDEDTIEISRRKAAQVRVLDFDRLVGGGVLHTKMWIVDRNHIFLGSANMDWRSLTQVKEVGVWIQDCPHLAKDAEKMFKIYWKMGEDGAVVPEHWPVSLGTDINAESPLPVTYGNNGSVSNIYFSSSPPQFVTLGRTGDIDAILRAIRTAKKFISISVMEYLPIIMFDHPKKYWPIIDDALKSAAIDRRIAVKILVGHWKHSPPEMEFFLKSFLNLNLVYPHVDIQVKRFIVPTLTPSQAAIPFARVNHDKFMVTDNVAYIGTSNWSGDYFINTAGIGIVVEDDVPHENE
ncbi:5'-3' exonuclease PLD3-like isoform X2 [Artemia franciscana]